MGFVWCVRNNYGMSDTNHTVLFTGDTKSFMLVLRMFKIKLNKLKWVLYGVYEIIMECLILITPWNTVRLLAAAGSGG